MFLISYIFVFLQSMKSSLLDQKDTEFSIVKKKDLLYDKNEILAKSNTFEWPRERLLTFLIVQRLISIVFNEKYQFAEDKNVDDFKKELKDTIELFTTFLKNAFDKNEWTYGDDKVSKKIKNIEEKLSLYVNNKDFYNLLQGITIVNESNEPAGQILTDLKAASEEDLKNLEVDFLLGEKSTLHDSLNDIFGVKKFYDDLFEHKDYLAISYCELRSFFPNIDMVTVICHDWSKYLLNFTIGYTYKFFLSKNDENNIIQTWNTMTGEKLEDNFFNKAFDIGFRIHFLYENHHPEYYKTPDATEFHDKSNILRVSKKNNMSDIEGLEESVVNMCGRNMFNTVQESIENFKKGTYITFKTFYLDRYNIDDAEKVVNLILEIIKALNTNEEYEKYKKIYEDFILQKRADSLSVSN